jgi:death-on-curing protein
VISVTGKGDVGVKCPEYLQDAISQPFQAGFGTEFYPDVADKIAVLIHSIITTHAFHDANKRTAMALGLAIAEANGQRIVSIDDGEIEEIAIGIATHTYKVPEISRWLTSHYTF